MSRDALVRIASDTVSRTQGRLPLSIRPLAVALPVLLEDRPSDALVADGVEADTLGLFSGDPHGEEDSMNPLPPQIFLFLENILDYCEGDLESFRDEVKLTYLHELGHYLGWDEDEVARRGLE